MGAGHYLSRARRWPAALALVLAAITMGLMAGCSGPSHGPSRPVTRSAEPEGEQPAGLSGLHPCSGSPGFGCGTLRVPLDPGHLVPGQLSLAVAVSRVATAPRGVLLLLTGGPGQPGVPFVTRLASRLGRALSGYRLVMMDQRGTGAGALNCPALQQEMGASDLTRPTPAAVRSCATGIGPDRRFYATSDTVADIDALRAALGVRKLTLDGVSYGSYVAERYALAFPARVSRLVLDSVVPSWNVDPLQLATMRRSATVLRAVCAAQHCGFDPASVLATVVRRYHDGAALLDTLVTMSVGAPAFPGMLAALRAAAAGQPAGLLSLIARVHAGDAATAGELSQGLHASTLCADLRMPWGGPGTPLAVRRARLTRAAARLAPAQTWPFDRATAMDNGFVQTCLYWPPVPASPHRPAPLAAQRLPEVPVLLLAGQYDLSTPLADARAEAAQAPDGHLVIFPAAGHSVQNRAVGNPAATALRQFLDGG